jgi:hypothetical protein
MNADGKFCLRRRSILDQLAFANMHQEGTQEIAHAL